jgi:hypothetical protein
MFTNEVSQCSQMVKKQSQCLLMLSNGNSIPVSRRRLGLVKDFLEKIGASLADYQFHSKDKFPVLNEFLSEIIKNA